MRAFTPLHTPRCCSVMLRQRAGRPVCWAFLLTLPVTIPVNFRNPLLFPSVPPDLRCNRSWVRGYWQERKSCCVCFSGWWSRSWVSRQILLFFLKLQAEDRKQGTHFHAYLQTQTLNFHDLNLKENKKIKWDFIYFLVKHRENLFKLLGEMWNLIMWMQNAICIHVWSPGSWYCLTSSGELLLICTGRTERAELSKHRRGPNLGVWLTHCE